MQAVVDDRNPDSGAHVARRPDFLDPDVLSRRSPALSPVPKMPLASKERIAERSGEGGTNLRVPLHHLVFDHANRVASGAVAAGTGHLDVVGSRFQAIGQHEAHGTGGPEVLLEQVRGDRVAHVIEQRAVDVHRVAHGSRVNVRRLRQVDLEVVGVGRRVDPPCPDFGDVEDLGIGDRASGLRHRLDTEAVERAVLGRGDLDVPGADRELPANQKMLPAKEQEAVVVHRDRVSIAVEKLAHRVLDARARTEHHIRLRRESELEVVLVPVVPFGGEQTVLQSTDFDLRRVAEAGCVRDRSDPDRVGAGPSRLDPEVVRPLVQSSPDQEIEGRPGDSARVAVRNAYAVVVVQPGPRIQVAQTETQQTGLLGQDELEVVLVRQRVDMASQGHVERQVEGRRARRARLRRRPGDGRRPRTPGIRDGPHLDVVAGAVGQSGEHVGQLPAAPDALLHRPVRVDRLVGAGQDVPQVVPHDASDARGRCPDHRQRLVARVDRADRRRGLGLHRVGKDGNGDESDQKACRQAPQRLPVPGHRRHPSGNPAGALSAP